MPLRRPSRWLAAALALGAACTLAATCGDARDGVPSPPGGTGIASRDVATPRDGAIVGADSAAMPDEPPLADAPDVPAGGEPGFSAASGVSSGYATGGAHAASADGGPTTADGDLSALAPTPTAGVSVPRNETVVPLYTATPTRTPTATPTRTPTPGASGPPVVGGCQMFPADNPWNADISQMPVDPNSATYIASINESGNGFLHADFGGGGAYGIPFIVVPQSQPLVNINFTAYGDESDPGPYPIPLNAPVEGGPSSTGDRHVLALQQGSCKLYELFSAYPQSNRWDAASGAVFDLSSNALRPDTWTSADAAGLPILAGLVRYDEVAAGEIHHAVRFTVGTVRRAWVHPATHYGTSTSTARPPYGAKLRLKASYDTSRFTGQARVILEALKKYGMIVADQGTSWYITGAADPRWDDNDLDQLKTVPGTAFEVVQLGTVYTYP
jgi:hypothetical protein